MKTMTILLTLCAVLLVPAISATQSLVAGQGDRLGWQMAMSDPAVAQGYVYTLSLDGVEAGAMTATTCEGAGPVVCVADFPPLLPGDFTATLVATDMDDVSSLPSPPLTLEFRVVVSPDNLIIVPRTQP